MVAEDPFTTIEKRSLREYRPLRAMLELTYRCNFRCKMCYLVEFRSPGELDTDEYCDVMDQLAAMGCMTLTFTGGEPLLRRDFFDLAHHAREQRFGLRVFSNGSLIDQTVAAELAALKPLAIEVSLYGMSEATYEAVTGQSRGFVKAIRAIELLRAHDVRVLVKTPVIQQNLHDLDAIAEYVKQVGASFAANPHITPKDNGDLSPLAHALTNEQLVEYFRRYVSAPRTKAMDPDGLMCNTGRSAMVISPLGDVFPCVQIKESVGNVRQRPLADIWRGSPILDELRALRVHDYPGCGSCGNGCGSSGGDGKREVRQQCAGIARMTTGSFTGGDPLVERLVRIQREARGNQGSSPRAPREE